MGDDNKSESSIFKGIVIRYSRRQWTCDNNTHTPYNSMIGVKTWAEMKRPNAGQFTRAREEGRSEISLTRGSPCPAKIK